MLKEFKEFAIRGNVATGDTMVMNQGSTIISLEHNRLALKAHPFRSDGVRA